MPARVDAGQHEQRAAAAGFQQDWGPAEGSRILGTLEPGGAQLSALQLSAALRRHGITTSLLAGDATPLGAGTGRPAMACPRTPAGSAT